MKATAAAATRFRTVWHGAQGRALAWLQDQRADSQSWMRTFHAMALIGILGLAFFMALIPKEEYRYPVHVDEWRHYGHALGTLESGNLTHPNPVGGRRLTRNHREAGFHVLLAQVRLVTDVSWITLFRYLPPFFLATTALLVYLFGRRDGIGLEAAMLVTLVPTTLRLLGPGFLVPMSMGILLLPAVLLLIHRLQFSPRADLLLWLILGAIFMIHPGMGFYLMLVVLLHMAAFLLHTQMELLPRLRAVGLALLGPALGAVLVFQVQGVGIGDVPRLLSQTADLPPFPKEYRNALLLYGWAPLGLAVLGVPALVWRLSWRHLALALSAVAVLVIIVAYDRYTVGHQTLADRGLMFFMTLAAIIGGYGLAQLRHLWPRALAGSPRAASWAKAGGLGTALALTALALALGIPSRGDELYYRIINDVRYRDALWIRDYTPEGDRTVLQHPDWGIAFPPLSGKYTFANSSVILRDADWRLEAADEVLRNGPRRVSGGRLGGYNVHIIYGAKDISDPNYIQPRPGIFLFREAD